MKRFDIFARLRAAYQNRAEPESLRTIAQETWRALIVISAALIIASGALGVWEFGSVSHAIAAAQSAPQQQSGGTLKKAQLDGTDKALQARGDAFDSLAAQPGAPVADPFSN